jgi:hypothetical protein
MKCSVKGCTWYCRHAVYMSVTVLCKSGAVEGREEVGVHIYTTGKRTRRHVGGCGLHTKLLFAPGRCIFRSSDSMAPL